MIAVQIIGPTQAILAQATAVVEIRNPKSEIRKKAEGRNLKQELPRSGTSHIPG